MRYASLAFVFVNNSVKIGCKITKIFPFRKKYFHMSQKVRIFANEKQNDTIMEASIRQPLNPAQLELLSTMASLTTETDLIELKQALARFFAERADREMERLWDNGTINEETLTSWEHEHMRTPYRQNNIVSI